MEKYLTEIQNVSVRKHVTKFRLSNHRLAIETGRHNGTALDERFCTFCPDKIENEIHFVFECSALKHLRDRLILPQIDGITGFEFFPGNFKIKTLMSDMKYETCKFIADGSDLRDYLISKPKTLD